MAWSESIDTTNSLVGDNLDIVKGMLHISDSSIDNNLNRMINEASWFCNRYTNRKLRSQSLNEKYDGDGSDYLYTDNYPITAITRIATGRNGIVRINNSSETTNATVSVSSSAVTCTLDGSASVIDFATYTTINDIVTAINALGSNWQAELPDSTYSSTKSTELITQFGSYCLDDTWIYLYIPDSYLDDYKVDEDVGEIYYSGGFEEGSQNVVIDYTAGYTTIPSDLQDACLKIIHWLYDNWEKKKFGLTARSLESGSVSISSSDIPSRALDMLDRYRRRNI